jgi:hypothetical protein
MCPLLRRLGQLQLDQVAVWVNVEALGIRHFSTTL